MIPNFIKEPNPEIYKSNNYLVLDFETTNIDKGDPKNTNNRLLLSVYGKESKYKYSENNEYLQGRLLQDISKVDFLIAHNTKFELQWLARCGLDLSQVLIYDTMIGQYVLDGNKKSPKDLNSIAKRYELGQKDSFVSKLIK